MLQLLSVLLVLVIIWSLLMLWRNERVCKFRLRMIDENFEDYKLLEDYDRMLYRFWIPLKKERWLKK